MNLTKNCRKTLSVKITNIFSGNLNGTHERTGTEQYVIATSFPKRGCVIGVLHTWSIEAPCFERWWSCCRWFFRFFLRECGFYRFKTNRRSTTINKKHKYRKQSEIKSQNQKGSGSKTCGFALSVCEFVFKQLAVCCCFPCTVGWLVS